MKKNRSLRQLLTLISLSSIVIISCNKEIAPSPSSSLTEIQNADILITENSSWGNWLHFNSVSEFQEYANDLHVLFSDTSLNADSLLDLNDKSLGFYSLREFYNTSSSDMPNNIDSSCYVPKVLSAMLNKYGIYQIKDTIYRVAKNNIFKINTGDVSLLNNVANFYNVVNINNQELPTGVSIIKLFGKSTPLNDVKAANGGYNIRFTQASYLYSKGETFKLVAFFSLYSVPYYTEFYTKSRFEKKKGTSKWLQEWAQPLTLSSSCTFVVSNTPFSNGTKSAGISQSADGKRIDILDWYWWDPYNPTVTGIDVIGLHSNHTARRDGITVTENIYY
jgi:hypothetical protein